MDHSSNANSSVLDKLRNELEGSRTNEYYILISIVCAIVWVIYLTYYNSRVLGLVLTTIVNRFMKSGHMHVGSFSISVLSGKIMFRDVHYVTEDYSVRIHLGFAIFRWWRPIINRDVTEDLSHSETRLSFYLDNYELHVYNRSDIYSRLEKLFGLDSLIIPSSDSDSLHSAVDEGGGEGKSGEEDRILEGGGNKLRGEVEKRKHWKWRDLIPVVKAQVVSGRLVFGNYLMPQSLCLQFTDAHIMYTTKPASTPFDQFMHIVKCSAEHVRIMLVPSPQYKGVRDEPPRSMGDGFTVMQSNDVEIYYYRDEPGVVPYEPEMVQLANGDVMTVRTWPVWGMDVKCGKNTDISYGPWSDRQREFLWKFFYPADYEPNNATVLPAPGEMRTWKSFDFKMSMQNEVTIDLLFTKNKETQAIHMGGSQGSYLEFTIPFFVEPTGYVTKISGQIMHLDASTSLRFRSLLGCETLQFEIEIRYPKCWNDHQDWKIDLTACKTSGFLVFQLKSFFADLVEDWSSKSRSDILKFIPYTVSVNARLKQFELATLTNEYNWIDCFGHNQENAHLGVCGEIFNLSFKLPFTDYLPATVPLTVAIKAENAKAKMFMPEQYTSRHCVVSLSESLKLMNRDGSIQSPLGVCGAEANREWRKVFLPSSGWVDVWKTPYASVIIGYMYHPMPPLKDIVTDSPADLPLDFPSLLAPLRPLRPKKKGGIGGSAADDVMVREAEFDPTTLDPDQINVEIDIGPTVAYAYGSLVRNFLHLKENYFGEDQKIRDFECEPADWREGTVGEASAPSKDSKGAGFDNVLPCSESKDRLFDSRRYRPLHVRVQLTIKDIQAHLVSNCLENAAPCPYVFVERVAFELDKKYEETMLQVILSPATLIAKDTITRPSSHSHLNDGHLALSGLQIRGHAMFSHEGLELDSETLEYAWLLELTIGDITGRLTAPQLQKIIEFLQTFLYLVTDRENCFERAVSYKLCQHMLPQPACMRPSLRGLTPCPTSDDLKYKVTRVSIDCIDLYLVESGAALNVQIYPVRLSTCNLHSSDTKMGLTVLIPRISFKQFVLSVAPSHTYNSDKDPWLEAGGLTLGPVTVDAAVTLPAAVHLVAQRRFLRLHDLRTQRLTFLWSHDTRVYRRGVGREMRRSVVSEDIGSPPAAVLRSFSARDHRSGGLESDRMCYSSSLKERTENKKNLHGFKHSSSVREPSERQSDVCLDGNEGVFDTSTETIKQTHSSSATRAGLSRSPDSRTQRQSPYHKDPSSENYQTIKENILRSSSYRYSRSFDPTRSPLLHEEVMDKCGCLGGCRFFGSNRNGESFFSPDDERDFTDGINAAVAVVCPYTDRSVQDFGYGQSILHAGRLVLESSGPPPLLVSHSTARPHRINLTQKDSRTGVTTDEIPGDLRTDDMKFRDESVGSRCNQWLANVTPRHGERESDRLDGRSSKLSAVDEREGDEDRDVEWDGKRIRDKQRFGSGSLITDEVSSISSPSADRGTSGSTMLPMGESLAASTQGLIRAASVGGSTAGLVNPIMASIARPSQIIPHHERTRSYDPPKTFRQGALCTSPDTPTSLSGGVSVSLVEGSRASLMSSTSGGLSRHSSLTSPVLRRLASLKSVHGSSTATTSTTAESGPSTTSKAARESSDSDVVRSGDGGFVSAVEELSESRDSLAGNGGRAAAHSERDDIVSVVSSHYSNAVENQNPDSSSSTDADSYASASSFMRDPGASGGLMGSMPGLHDETLENEDLYDDDTLAALDRSGLGFEEEEREREEEREMEDDSDTTHIPLVSNYISLHSQINQPIARSPLLMGCYLNHMTQLHCADWSSAVRHPCLQLHEKNSERRSPQRAPPEQARPTSDPFSIGSNQDFGYVNPLGWIPRFSYLTEGFSPSLMVPRAEVPSPQTLSTPSTSTADLATDAAQKSSKYKRFFSEDIDQAIPQQADFDGTSDGKDKLSKVTAVVDLQGSVDIMISPLMLEALQRFMEAMTPVLANLHPSSIVDGLHFMCTDSLESRNKLKQTNTSTEKVTDKKLDEITAPVSGAVGESGGSAGEGVKPEVESKTSRVELILNLSKINICILQASLVEEMISVSALERARELTCVSILAASIDGLSLQLLISEITKRKPVSQSESSPRPQQLVVDSKPLSRQRSYRSSLSASAGSQKKLSQRERNLIESSQVTPPAVAMVTETCLSDMVGSLNLSRIHLQLRRVKKNSNYSDNVFLTAVPEYRSNVMFTFHRSGAEEEAPYLRQMSSKSARSDHADQTDYRPGRVAEELAGFIMFECGLEDIKLQAARREGYPVKDKKAKGGRRFSVKNTEENKDETVKETGEEMKDGTKLPSSQVAVESNADVVTVTLEGTPGVTFAGLSKPTSSKNTQSKLGESSSEDSAAESIGGDSADDEASGGSHRASVIKEEDEDDLASCDNKQRDEQESSAADVLNEGAEVKQKVLGDASCVLLTFKTVWFNFAAPPPSPRKLKLEYTRYDWNLLSTATPAINAWMNPSHRAILAANTLYSQLNHRFCSVMACLMTDALDVQGIHMPVKSKYNRLTSLSRALQEDPSCQLLTVLRRYIHKVGVNAVEESLHTNTMPQLITIKKGLLVLTRQWKNVLYMPMLAETNFKAKKNTVTFAIPIDDTSPEFEDVASMDDNDDDDEFRKEVLRGSEVQDDVETGVGGGGGGADQYDIVDEKTSLLQAEVETPRDDRRGGRGRRSRGEEEGEEGSLISGNRSARGEELMNSAEKTSAAHLSAGQPNNGSNVEMVPQVTVVLNANKHDNESGRVIRGDDVHKMSNLTSSGSVMSDEQQQQRHSLTRQNQKFPPAELPGRGTNEDMQRWMVLQQEYTRINASGKGGGLRGLGYSSSGGQLSSGYPSLGHDSWTLTGVSDMSQDEDSLNVRRVAAMTHPAFQLADAQVLFKPLLRSMGLQLDPVKMSAVMKKFGGNISISGTLTTLKIEIVDSEYVKNPTRGGSASSVGGAARSNRSTRSAHLPKFRIDTTRDLPAFLCDTFDVQLSMKEIVDSERKAEGRPGLKREISRDNQLEEEDEEEEEEDAAAAARRKSWHALKMALNQIEARPATTKVNFAVNCRSMSQHVNVSLLRLVHQFVTMIENIAKTKVELNSDKQQVLFRGGLSTPVLTPSECATSETETTNEGSSPYHPSSPLARQGARGMGSAVGQQSKHSKLRRPDQLPTKLRKPTGEANTQSPLHSLNTSDSVAIDMNTDTSSPMVGERTMVEEIREQTPRCWKTLYYLLDLYSSMPEMKTFDKPTEVRAPSLSRLSIIDEGVEPGLDESMRLAGDITSTKPVVYHQRTSSAEVSKGSKVEPHTVIGGGAHAAESGVAGMGSVSGGGVEDKQRTAQRDSTTQNMTSSVHRAHIKHKPFQFTQSVVIREQVPLIVFGVAKFNKIRVSAMLSGLKLEAELSGCQASASHREKLKGVTKKRSHESSATASIGSTAIVLLEGNPPAMQTVVKFKIGETHGLYSSLVRHSTATTPGMGTTGGTVFHRSGTDSTVTSLTGAGTGTTLPAASFNAGYTSLSSQAAATAAVSSAAAAHNSGLLTVGLIEIDIPQHPVALHSMVARSSKRLSTTLQEFIRLPAKSKASFDLVDMGVQHQPSASSFIAGTGTSTYKHSPLSEVSVSTLTAAPSAAPQGKPGEEARSSGVAEGRAEDKTGMNEVQQAPSPPSAPLIMHFKAQLKGIAVGASLLPSLRAQYKIGKVTSSGVTGNRAHFTVDLPTHSLSFASKVSAGTSIPSSAEIALPPVHVQADYRQWSEGEGGVEWVGGLDRHGLAEGLVLREGSYLEATADVGVFEHILTTDLLNHLVFMQKVFMKEVNEVVQKVSGVDQPVPLWSDNWSTAVSTNKQSLTKPLLYSFHFCLKGIQITATTPTSNALRLETSAIELELSNRVCRADQSSGSTSQPHQQKESKSSRSKPSTGSSSAKPKSTSGSTTSGSTYISKGTSLKMFIKARIGLNLTLGVLLKNPMFEEAEADLQPLAKFDTQITLRNALQDEMIPRASKDQEALLIVVQRPTIFILPAAFDRAVLVWLNYKNAYEYWTEQRLALNKEFKSSLRSHHHQQPQQQQQQQGFKLFPSPAATAQGSEPGLTGGGGGVVSTLFLQLTVDDLGVCLPLNPFSQGLGVGNKLDDTGAALILTLESTQISACSCGSLVSKGKFTGFCLRFADDFDVGWDDWKPNPAAGMVMNVLVVPDGTYEVCSRTINAVAAPSSGLISDVRPGAGPSAGPAGFLYPGNPGAGPSAGPTGFMYPGNTGRAAGVRTDEHTDTTTQNSQVQSTTNAKWILNVSWQMRGIDIHLDTNIGKRLSAIGNTVTTLTGEQQEGNQEEEDQAEIPSVKLEPPSRKQSMISENLPDFVYDQTLDPKTRARRIENEMNEQAKVVQDLKKYGAKKSTIEGEEKKLLELQAAVFHDFRQDLRNKLKRKSVKANALKDNLGLGAAAASTSTSSTSRASFQKSKSVTGRTKSRSGGLQRPASYSVESEEPGRRHGRTVSVDAADVRPGRPVRFRGEPLLGMESDDEATEDSSELEDETVVPSHNTSRSSVFPSVAEDGGRFGRDRAGQGSEGKQQSAQTRPSQIEPNVDFELDVRVGIDSGKCVLHPKDSKSSADFENDPGRRKHNLSPRSERKKSVARKVVSSDPLGLSFSSRMGQQQQPSAATSAASSSCTVFFLPGVDVKVHYNSRTGPAVDVINTSTSIPRTVASDTRSSTHPVAEGRSDWQQIHSGQPGGGMQESRRMSGAVLEEVVVEGVELRGATQERHKVHSTPSNPLNISTVSSVFTGNTSTSSSKKVVVKKANLYAWISLQQLSEEMLISPALLDFLEQAIEPIPLSQLGNYKANKTPAPTSNVAGTPKASGGIAGVDLDISASSLASNANYVYNSFPVDVVVYLRIKPSMIRFTCLPVSRVECLLSVPSVDVVFSSKKLDDETGSASESSSGFNYKIPRQTSSTGLKRPSSGTSRSRGAAGSASQTGMGEGSVGGGLSITGCLSDFSLYIFHPYGGGQKKTLSTENPLRRGLGKPSTFSGDEKVSSMLDSGRKDSFSLNVEFVKVNISRSRKGAHPEVFPSASTTSGGSLGLDSSSSSANIVRISAVCDIGTASLKYDMRRLLEILALPKAWYRRSLARRMFLGEEPAVQDSDEDGFGNVSSSPPTSSESSLLTVIGHHHYQTLSPILSSTGPQAGPGSTDRSRHSVGAMSDNFCDALSHQGLTPSSSHRMDSSSLDDCRADQYSTGRRSGGGGGLAAEAGGIGSSSSSGIAGGGKGSSNWETLVLFAVSLSQLEVMINMSNVMGNTVWSTKDLKSQGRLSIDSGGYKNMKISTGLGRSRLEARGGIIGGSLELQELNTLLGISEERGREPEHMTRLHLDIIETRLDYMGSSILMFRFSDLDVALRDKWQVEAFHKDKNVRPSSMANNRSLSTFVDGELKWDKLHMMISRSTTPDLFKIVHKLNEFFTQQMTSSKRVLSGFGQITSGTASSVASSRRDKSKDEDSWISEIRHHRHWQRVLEHLRGSRLSNFLGGGRQAERGTLIGGMMTLQGHNISLACFHGINFRSKSWALFTMNEPYISFATEAADVLDGTPSKKFTHVVQNLSFQLGQCITEMGDSRPMAMVCKLSRGHYMPPPFNSVQDWFHYAFSTAEIKGLKELNVSILMEDKAVQHVQRVSDLDSFPQMLRQQQELQRQESERLPRKPVEHSHETEIIFILPSLEMHLKTEHMQAEQEPQDGEPKPVVTCSFVTQFDDHILVAMDAEALFFLHDLVINYVKEKDRGTSKISQKQLSEAEKEMLENPTMVLKQDYRDFDCKTWHLEPTVRLLSWAGKRIDPVAVDYILQRLGFQHARLTIPKWMQRGCMDPLDKIISLLVDRLLTSLEEEVEEES